jgi:hypothetical protein
MPTTQFKVHLWASEAQIEPHPITKDAPISPEQVESITLGPFEGMPQLTYGTLRDSTSKFLAMVDGRGFWSPEVGLPVLAATRRDGSSALMQTVPEDKLLFTDVVFELADSE